MAESDGNRRPPSGKPVKEVVPDVINRRYPPPAIEDMMRAIRNKLAFVTILTSRVCPENAKIKLSCVVQGPDPMVRWFKDNTPVVYSARIKNMSRDGVCVLEISDCVPEDSGVYQMIARNQDSDITCSCSLQVYATEHNDDLSPTFTRNLKHSYHLNINEISLDTHVHGVPRPTIEWYKDCVLIEKDDPKYQRFDHADGTQELIVNTPDATDSGKFSCKATNRAGDADIAHPLIFEGKAHHVIDNRHRSFHADQSHLDRAKIDAQGGIPGLFY